MQVQCDCHDTLPWLISFSLDPCVNPPATSKNPLWFVAVAFLVTLPFDFYWYVGQRFFTAFGMIVIAAKISFLVLYIRHSRFAWHVGVAVTAMITPLSLLLVRLGSEAAQHPHSHPRFELAVVVVLLVYLWKIRERYRQYVEAKI
jgi:hypothetical protein